LYMSATVSDCYSSIKQHYVAIALSLCLIACTKRHPTLQIQL
jgi:hypothetical protein